MSETMEQLIAHICTLPSPIDLEHILALFEKYPLDSMASTPDECIDEWRCLTLLKNIVDEGINIKNQSDDLQLHHQESVSYQAKLITTRGELERVEREIAAAQRDITPARTRLTELYQSMGLTVASYEGEEEYTRKQLEQVLAVKKKIEAELRLFASPALTELPIIKLRILRLKEQLLNATKTMQRLESTYQFEISRPHADNKEFVNERLSQLREIQTKLEELKDVFIKNLPLREVRNKIIALQQQQYDLAQEEEALKSVIGKYKPTQEMQDTLIREFNSCADVDELIKNYADKASAFLTYVEPYIPKQIFQFVPLAFKQFAPIAEFFPKPDKEAHEFNQCAVNFLTVLKKEKIRLALAQQVEELTKLDALEEPTVPAEQLINMATQLLNMLPLCQVPDDFEYSQSLVDYYCLLSTNMLLIPRHIKDYELLIDLFDSLPKAQEELASLRKDYKLPEEQDGLLPSISILEAVVSGTEIAEKNKRLSQCFAFFTQALDFQAKLSQRDALELERAEYDIQVQALACALKDKEERQSENSFTAQIAELSRKLALIQERVILQINALTLPKRDKTPQEKVQSPSSHPSLTLELLSFEETDLMLSSDSSPRDLCLDSRSLGFVPAPVGPADKLRDLPVSNLIVVATEVPALSGDNISAPLIVTALEDENMEGKAPSPIRVGALSTRLDRPTDADYGSTGGGSIAPEVVPEPLAIIALEQTCSAIEALQDEPEKARLPLGEQISIDSCNEAAQQEALIIYNAEYEQLKIWHEFNHKTLLTHPHDLQEWYAQLYQLAEKAVRQIPPSYKHAHLIRDVFFELQHGNPLDVLQAYKRICPNPTEGCEILLALKPNYSLTEPACSYLDDKALPLALQKINQQYKKLKPQYPKEAELVQQALFGLFATYTEQQNKGLKSTLPLISADPRYIPLQRHRGFLKIWELIEDFCRLVIGVVRGEAPYEYHNKPCFFATRSYTLLKDAETALNPTMARID